MRSSCHKPKCTTYTARSSLLHLYEQQLDATDKIALSPTEGRSDLLDFEDRYTPACLKASHQRTAIYSGKEQYIRALSGISHMWALSPRVIQGS